MNVPKIPNDAVEGRGGYREHRLPSSDRLFRGTSDLSVWATKASLGRQVGGTNEVVHAKSAVQAGHAVGS